MHWSEDEEFWRELFPVMFPDDRFEAASAQIDQVLGLAGVHSGAVLDLCCGPGRHSVELARRGFHVTGVDRTAYLLDQARSRDTDQAVEWVQQDMREFRRPGAFDVACNLFTSFGYFDAEADNLKVLRNVYESLKPGGVFVMELLGKERLARVWQSSICSDYPGGITLVQRPKVAANWSRVENEWILIKEGRARTFRFGHWIYSGRELQERLTGSGFATVELFGDLGGSPYGVDALRLVAVAKKSG